MKKLITLFLLIFLIGKISAQNETDALNLSQYFAGGTARGLAMSGAYGALGGDFTSLSINPAGIGVYRSSEFVFTPSLTFNSEKSNYYGTSYTDNKTRFGFSNFGLVLNSTSSKDIGWIGISFGFGYNKLVDFNKNVTIYGTNTNTSFLDELTRRTNDQVESIRSAQGSFDPDLDYKQLDYYYAQLGIDANAIFYEDSIGYYISDLYYDGYNQYQRRTFNQKGNIGEYTFSLGANYSNKFYWGATIGLQSVYFSKNEMHSEDCLSSNYISEFTYKDEYTIKGGGINLKLGMIYKPIDFLRLGFALHTPTFYSLHSEFTNEMQTIFSSDYSEYDKNLYSDYLESDFTLNSPLKMIFSCALQNKLGVISADYEYVDYSKSRIGLQEDYKSDEIDINNSIDYAYQATSNIKVGGEIKLGSAAIRAGYGFYGSPYASTEFNKTAKTQSFSCGIGFRGENSYIDIGYIAFLTNYKYSLYRYDAWDQNGEYYAANELASIEQKNSKFVVTFGFKF
jgi:hypothetical protein